MFKPLKNKSHMAELWLSLILLFVNTFAGASLPVAAAPELFGIPAANPAGSIAPESAAPTIAPPGVLEIPVTQTAPTIDGFCSDYSDAISQTFQDGGGAKGTVYLKYDSSYLYMCIEANQGSFDNRFGRLYLDPQGDGANYVFAQKDDYGLQVDILNSVLSSFHGSDIPNGYVADSSISGFWTGAAKTATPAGGPGESVEYRVTLGRFQLDTPCQLFGLAGYHHWFSAVGDDYGWPSNQYFDQPRTWQLVQLANPGCTDRQGKIAYVFRGSTADATSYYNLLTGAGYSVTLVPLSSVLATNFAAFNLIIVANDSGNLNDWGSSGLTDDQVVKITAPNIPIIGLGEGGYAFFGQLASFIGWPNGWHGPQSQWNKAGTGPMPFFTGIAADPIPVYGAPVNSVGIYLSAGPIPADVVPVTLEDPTKDHASLILQGCHLLWGGSGNPYAMAADGQSLFLNSVAYMLPFQCPPTTPPPTDCVQISKSAVPAPPAHVHPGDVIEYTITYTLSNDPVCQSPMEATLIDSIPLDTIFVPGSAGPGVVPGADGSLVWTVTPGAASQTKTFKVVVSENQCADARMVNNRAGLLVGSNPPVISNVVSLPVDCPFIGFPNDDPMFAEGEISIHPYPLVVGQPSTIQVKITNNSPSAEVLNVAFQTSPSKFGIGLNFSAFDTRVVSVPAHSSVIVQGVFVPAASGHYCIQIVVTGSILTEPLVTQRNIDVTEELSAGVPDTLTFKVRNNSSTTNDVALVVDNTCPGWSAVITDPADGVLHGMMAGEIRDATMTVTPPNPVVLGSGCHIDVQGWIGDTMIGGIRKLDVPPVQLPTGVNPPWMEPEITFNPDPPVAGHAGQMCIELQNPLGAARTVTVDFSVADFGAGIPFTSIGTKTFVLPANSLAKYCIDWTPSSGGTLHRCALVTLKQPGYQDMRSQRNVDILPTTSSGLGSLLLPFKVRNPDLVGHQLNFDIHVFGIDPYWVPTITGPNPGDPPPTMLGSGETADLFLRLLPAVAANKNGAALAPPADYGFGDVHQAEVTVLLDDQSIGGFTAQLITNKLFLPIVNK